MSSPKERGAVTIVVLGMMAAVLGLGAIVIDGGMLYYERARLQTAVDAVVLAGASALLSGSSAAQNAAQSAAQANNLPLASLNLTIDVNARTVQARASRNVPLGLARALAQTNATVGAKALAQVSGISGLQGVAPLGVIWQNFIFGQLYDLKVGGGSGEGGNYGALALGGTGSSNFRDNLRHGYEGWLRTGDRVQTEPGNMSGPTKNAIEDRLAACTHGCTHGRHIPNCPRVMLVAIIDDLPDGRGEVTILGFAAFFLDDHVGSGKNSFVRGRFIRLQARGEAGGTATHGVSLTRLVR